MPIARFPIFECCETGKIFRKGNTFLYKKQKCVSNCQEQVVYQNENLLFFVYFSDVKDYPVAYRVEFRNTGYVGGYHFPKILELEHSLSILFNPEPGRSKMLKVLYQDKAVKIVTFDFLDFVFALKARKDEDDVDDEED